MSVRTARRRDLRLLPVAGAAWAGAGVAITFPEHAGVWAVVLWAAAVAFLGVALRRARPTVLALVAVSFAVAAAAASHVALAQPARDAVAGLEVDGGRSVTFEVDVVGKVERSATGYRFDATTRSATVGDDARPVSAPVVVRTPERAPGLDLGARATVTGTAFRADPGDRAVLVIEASALVVDRPPSGPLGVAATLRTGLVAAVAGLPDPGAGLVPGLAVGDTSAVSDELDQQMKASSLSHLTAVSGVNCERGGESVHVSSNSHRTVRCGRSPDHVRHRMIPRHSAHDADIVRRTARERVKSAAPVDRRWPIGSSNASLPFALLRLVARPERHADDGPAGGITARPHGGRPNHARMKAINLCPVVVVMPERSVPDRTGA